MEKTETYSPENTVGLGQKNKLVRHTLTVSKVRVGLKLCSHCIISKKMGMVAFLSSGSGTSVTSRMGPTMAGINFNLCGPEGQQNITTQKYYGLICEGNMLHFTSLQTEEKSNNVPKKNTTTL